MGDEIEKKCLLGKLNELIQQVCSEKKPLPSQISQLHLKFDRLKTILEKEVIESSSNTKSIKISRETLYNLNNLLSEWQSKQLSPCSLDSLNYAPKCAIALENILKELSKQSDDNQSQHSRGETISDDIPEAAYRWTNQYVDQNNIRGTKDKEIFLRRLILPQPSEKDTTIFRMFGLVGMRGIGKSTLAQMVFNHQDIKKHYLPRLWVCVSKQPYDDEDPKKEIVKRILTSLGVEDEFISYVDTKHHLEGLLYALRQQLLGKRYLIVLDDVYIEDKGYLEYISNLDKNIKKYEEKLAYGLPKEDGGAIIVTSRSKEIASKIVGEENLHSVLPLSNDDCWEIFKYIYEEECKSMSPDMKSLENKIREKCHGLPLAAKMMGEKAKGMATQPTKK